MSEEAKNKISESKKGTVAWNKGKKTGPMKKEHIINSANAHKKPVIMLDKERNIIKEYAGAVDAKKDGFNSDSISLVCRGKGKTHKGYKWEFKVKDE